MKSERIQIIHKECAYPDSLSVQQALFKVWDETEFAMNLEIDKLKEHIGNSHDKAQVEITMLKKQIKALEAAKRTADDEIEVLEESVESLALQLESLDPDC